MVAHVGQRAGPEGAEAMNRFAAIHTGAVGEYVLPEEARRRLLAGERIEIEFGRPRPATAAGEPFEDDRERLIDEARD